MPARPPKIWTQEELREWAAQELARRRPDPEKVALTITGGKFLLRCMTDSELRAAMHLGAITKFQELLMKLRGSRHRATRMTRLDRVTLKELESGKQDRLIDGVPVVAKILTYRIALAAGVAPSTVTAALILYGLESLAKELRESKRAMMPTIPSLTDSSSVVAPTSRMNPSFPSHEER